MPACCAPTPNYLLTTNLTYCTVQAEDVAYCCAEAAPGCAALARIAGRE